MCCHIAVLDVTLTFGNSGLSVDCVATGYPGPVTATLSPTTRDSRNLINGTDTPFQFVRRALFIFLTCNSSMTYTCIGMAGSSQQSLNATPVCCKYMYW